MKAYLVMVRIETSSLNPPVDAEGRVLTFVQEALGNAISSPMNFDGAIFSVQTLSTELIRRTS